jgi:xylulokinase
MKYLIGVDLGTQTTKAGIADERGNMLAESARGTNLIYPEDDAVEQDPEEMLSSVVDAIGDVMEASGVSASDVAGVCLDGQMAGVMGVDRDGMAAIPYDSWLDTRCGNARRAFLEYGEERTIAITGGPVSYTAGPKIMWWKENRPEAYGRIYKFVQPAAYCTMRLCGLGGDAAFYDHTYLHFSGFADTARRTWSEELTGALGVDQSKFPRIVRPSDVVGGLTEEMAERCGLISGTPLVAGCGDTAATGFGAGVTKPGLMFDVAGTASVLACAVREFAPDTKRKTILFAPSVVEGLYMPMAYINGGGMCLKWFRDDVLGGSVTYAELDALAADVRPGSDNLLFVPQFSGRVCPNDTLVRGAYIGLRWVHGRGHLFRAVMEGVAYEYAIYKDIIEGLVPDQDYERVLSIGGGSVSELFSRIKADALGVPISTGAVADTALRACHSIAGYGVGLFDDIAALTLNHGDYGKMTIPDASLHADYGARKDVFEGLYGALHDTYERLLKL